MWPKKGYGNSERNWCSHPPHETEPAAPVSVRILHECGNEASCSQRARSQAEQQLSHPTCIPCCRPHHLWQTRGHMAEGLCIQQLWHLQCYQPEPAPSATSAAPSDQGPMPWTKWENQTSMHNGKKVMVPTVYAAQHRSLTEFLKTET